MLLADGIHGRHSDCDGRRNQHGRDAACRAVHELADHEAGGRGRAPVLVQAEARSASRGSLISGLEVRHLTSRS